MTRELELEKATVKAVRAALNEIADRHAAARLRAAALAAEQAAAAAVSDGAPAAAAHEEGT